MPFSINQRFQTMVSRSFGNGRMTRLPFMSAALLTSADVMIE
jgi:hypothetical protein